MTHDPAANLKELSVRDKAMGEIRRLDAMDRARAAKMRLETKTTAANVHKLAQFKTVLTTCGCGVCAPCIRAINAADEETRKC